MSIQWYPGHMRRASNEMIEALPLVNVVIEVLDARIPFSSSNPFIQELSADKPHIKLLNKTDLVNEENSDYLNSMLARYEEIGYPVTRASTESEHGLDELKATLREHISVFVGQSGVGKSSLVNSLLPGTDSRIGALSEATAKGRHTTTTARLYHFPDGGSLIDSPGIREFALWNMDREKVLAGFIEFRPFLGLCRFRDCKHEHEPRCALLAAEAEDKIRPERMASYRQIIASLTAE